MDSLENTEFEKTTLLLFSYSPEGPNIDARRQSTELKRLPK